MNRQMTTIYVRRHAMKTKPIWILAISILATLSMTLSSCKKDETTSSVNNTVFSTPDLEGVWMGDLRFVGVTGSPVPDTINAKMTFGPNGTFISMVPSPVYLSISGNLSVAADGKITGIITTTHKTDTVNVETTTMNWAGSAFEAKTKINVNMNWPWQNTAPGSGSFLITGVLNKQ